MFTNQSDRYYQIMRGNLGDKMRMLDHLPNQTRTVLDVGGGDGVLAEQLVDHAGIDVTVVDASEESVRHVEALGRVKATLAYADELDRTGLQDVDAILASSILHEVFSYGNRAQNSGRTSNVLDFFKSAKGILRPGGRIIVREGVSPSRTAEGVMYVPDAEEDIARFRGASPFWASSDKDRSIMFTKIGDDQYLGTQASLFEFLTTWTWGPDSFDREVQEYLNTYTLEEMIGLGTRVGFSCVHAEQYVQHGYKHHLEDKGVKMSFPFPFTKGIWVFEK